MSEQKCNEFFEIVHKYCVLVVCLDFDKNILVVELINAVKINFF